MRGSADKAILMKAVEYFGAAAGGYARFRDRTFLRTLRQREEAVIMRLLDPGPGESILDAGCGAGYYSLRIMRSGASAYGVDISPAMVEGARARGVEAVVGDLASLSLGRRFDKILCAGVLEFCPDHKAVLSRLSDHLKGRGSIVVLVPGRSPAGWAYALYHRSHGVAVRLFDAEDLRALGPTGLALDAIEVPTPMSLVARLSPSR